MSVKHEAKAETSIPYDAACRQRIEAKRGDKLW